MSSIVRCEKIERSYHDGEKELRVLRGIDLHVEQNEILAISGSSGAGKSTLLHLLGTLDAPTSGEIYFGDAPLSKMSKKEVDRLRNEEIGFVFQFYHLLREFTALENVMMPALTKGARAKDCKERAEELLATVGLAERMRHRPDQLSGGEQQRVAIARALFNSPSVIMADEPTGNLDETTGEGIIDLLFSLNENESTTLILVTHDLNLARRAHRWVHLHEGVAEVRS